MLFRAVVMLDTCIRKVVNSNLGQVIGYYAEIFIVFSSVFQAIPGYYLEIDHARLLSNSYLLTIYDHRSILFDCFDIAVDKASLSNVESTTL
jgi:hypothetical protein